MALKATFCDPFRSDIIQLGVMDKNEVISKFKSICWRDYLDRMSKAQDSDIYYSPSLEIENMDNGTGITISAVDDQNGGVEYDIFYKRPKLVANFFGLVKKMNKGYVSDITGQTEEESVRCITGL